MQFCPRSYYFATGNADGSAMLWVTDRLQPLRIFSDAYSDVGCIDFHPNCNYVAGGSDDRYVRVWDVLTGTCVRTFAGHKDAVRGIKVSNDESERKLFCLRFVRDTLTFCETFSFVVYDNLILSIILTAAKGQKFELDQSIEKCGF